LSLQLDATLFGIKPAGFHATNVVLHAANVVLLFAWLSRVTGTQWRSLAVAALFGLHPLHVESVAWVAERKDVLSTFWLLVSLHAYERYAHHPKLKWYLITCTTFSLGLLSKSMVVTLPLLLLIVDIWPLNRCGISASSQQTDARYPQWRFGYLIVEKIPLFGLSLLDGIVTIVSQSHGTAFKQPNGLLIDRLSHVVHSYGWYIVKTLKPTGLMAFYARPQLGMPRLEVAGSALLLLAITIYVVLRRRFAPHLVFGWAWYFISFLPVIGLVQVGMQAHADRYSYVPHIGLFVMIVWECGYWIRGFPASRTLSGIALAATVLVFGLLTVNQVAVWKNTDSLWSHALSIDPQSSFIHGSMAVFCLETGRIDEAVKHFEFVTKENPEKKAYVNSFVEIYRKYAGRPEAQSEFRTELGMFYANEKSLELARINFEKAVSILPDNKLARYQLALALGDLGRTSEAKSHLEKLIEQDPTEMTPHIALGLILEKSGDLSAAREHFLIVLKHNPESDATINKVKSLNQRLGVR
jgi:Tfp pilus assembly protein PilF